MSSGETVVGVIDVGSNTIHLAVVGVTEDGRLRYLADETELVRLGEDVSATGVIGPERMARALTILAAQVDRARACHAEMVLGVATEGVRGAANGAELIERAERECALRLRLVSGEQEASLTYWGATWPWAGKSERQAALDLGGGSLEIVIGEGRRIVWRVSLPLGSGALYARHVRSDPPAEGELVAVDAEVSEALATIVPPLPVARVVACGGTATSVERLAGVMGLTRDFTPEETLTIRTLDETLGLLRERSATTLQSASGIDQARLRLISPGAVALRGAVKRLSAGSFFVSRAGVREGAALAFAYAGDQWPELAARGEGW
jgi:exopolyphosphatase/guanosine-5'-triphosphate,3'-diphosphate pyrophosphatase